MFNVLSDDMFLLDHKKIVMDDKYVEKKSLFCLLSQVHTRPELFLPTDWKELFSQTATRTNF